MALMDRAVVAPASIAVKNETDSLEDPVTGMGRREEVRFEDEADAHRVPPIGSRVDGRLESVL